jgi:hypothetical protein
MVHHAPRTIFGQCPPLPLPILSSIALQLPTPLNSITHQTRHSFAALTTSSFTLSKPRSFTLVLAEARTTHVTMQCETDGGKENGDERE